MQIDLAEFVSDYMALDAGEPFTNEDVAAAYVEATLEDKVTTEEFERRVSELTSQIGYYTGLPS